MRGVLHSRDRFGTEFHRESNTLALATPPAGRLHIELTAPYLTNTSQLTLSAPGFDPAAGTFSAYNWEIINAVTAAVNIAGVRRTPPGTYQLTPNNLNMLRMGYVLKAEAVYQDWFNNAYTVTAYTNYDELRANSNAPTEGGFVINGPRSFAPGGQLFYILTTLRDANGVGTVQAQWYKKTAPHSEYIALPGATEATYEFTAADFADTTPNYPPEIRLVLRHIDRVGNENAELLAGAIVHQDQPPAPITIAAAGVQAGDLVSLVQPVTDPNGLTTVTYQWQTGAADFSTRAVRSTLAEYRLGAADFNPHTHVRLVAAVHDNFGGRVTVTSNVLPIAAPGRGTISLNVYGGVPAIGAVVTVLTAAVQDPNGGTFSGFTWTFSAGAPAAITSENNFYPLTPAALTQLEAGSTLQVAAEYTDSLGFPRPLSAQLTLVATRANYPLQGNLQIRGQTSFGYETRLTADVTGLSDQNGIANLDYQWQISYDAGATFQVVRYATRPVFYHEIEDWDTDRLNQLRQPPIVRSIVTVMDNDGYATTVTAQITHQDARPRTNLLISIPGVEPGAQARVSNFIEDPNVVRPGTIRHRWQTGPQDFASAREAAVHYSRHRADTTNRYTLQAADFNETNEYLRLVTDYQDIFGRTHHHNIKHNKN